MIYHKLLIQAPADGRESLERQFRFSPAVVAGN